MVKTLVKKISLWNRTRKWMKFMSLFDADKHPKILDVGYTNSNGSGMICTNFLERHYPFLEDVTALGVENNDQFSSLFPKVNAIRYDGNEFPFLADSFDIVFSNAVIEHVGGVEKQKKFIKEMLRVKRKFVFFTTPNKYFPIEVHSHIPFLHWLPKNTFDAILVKVGQPEKTGDYMNLLSKKDIEVMLDELGISQYTIINNKFLGFTLDFIVLIEGDKNA